MQTTPGTVVAGRYRLDTDVSGPDGIPSGNAPGTDSDSDSVSFWLGHDVVLDRPVRIRLLDRDHPRVPAVLAAARSRALVDDRRLNYVLDADDTDECVLVVTSLPVGTTLEALLTDGPLATPEVLGLLRETAEVLVAAHAQGLAHLILGPGDVVLGPESEITVCGLAVDAVVRGVEVPDDADGRARADTRALGALLYACLTARWPDGASASSTLPPAPTAGDGVCTPRQVRAAVPADVDLLCRRALGEDVGAGPLDTPARFAAELAGLDVNGRHRRRARSWFGGRAGRASAPVGRT